MLGVTIHAIYHWTGTEVKLTFSRGDGWTYVITLNREKGGEALTAIRGVSEELAEAIDQTIYDALVNSAGTVQPTSYDPDATEPPSSGTATRSFQLSEEDFEKLAALKQQHIRDLKFPS